MFEWLFGFLANCFPPDSKLFCKKTLPGIGYHNCKSLVMLRKQVLVIKTGGRGLCLLHSPGWILSCTP